MTSRVPISKKMLKKKKKNPVMFLIIARFSVEALFEHEKNTIV